MHPRCSRWALSTATNRFHSLEVLYHTVWKELYRNHMKSPSFPKAEEHKISRVAHIGSQHDAPDGCLNVWCIGEQGDGESKAQAADQWCEAKPYPVLHFDAVCLSVWKDRQSKTGQNRSRFFDKAPPAAQTELGRKES